MTALLEVGGVLTAREGDPSRAARTLARWSWLALPAWRLHGDGSLRPDPAASACSALASAAARAGVPVWATLAPRSPAALAAWVRHPDARQRALEGAGLACLRLPSGEAPAGLLLDLAPGFPWEESSPAWDGGLRDELSAWVEEAAWLVRRRGALLAAAVEPQVREPGPGDTGFPSDYRVLGAYVDRLVVRGFGFRGTSPPPHPPAPVGWLRSVLEHALAFVPQRALVLALPAFGWRWCPGLPRPQRWPACASPEGERRRDPATASVRVHRESPGGREEAWLDDEETLAAKAALAAELGAGGIALWGAGWEPPGVWEALGFPKGRQE